jgi:TetR/AcrR family transcriptional regulator, transcriptional repressor for nem operon
MARTDTPQGSTGTATGGGTRERLIDTTQRLLWAHGYAGVSVDRICKEAGVKKGSFYHFFPSKEDLVLAALDALWEIASTGIYAKAFDKALHPLERLNRFAELTYGYHVNMVRGGEWRAEQGCPFGNVGAEGGADDVRIRARVRRLYEQEVACFEGALADAVAAGAIPAQDVTVAARRLVALQSGLFNHAKVYDDVAWLLQFIPAAARLIGAPVRDGRLLVPAAGGAG